MNVRATASTEILVQGSGTEFRDTLVQEPACVTDQQVLPDISKLASHTPRTEYTLTCLLVLPADHSPEQCHQQE